MKTITEFLYNKHVKHVENKFSLYIRKDDTSSNKHYYVKIANIDDYTALIKNNNYTVEIEKYLLDCLNNGYILMGWIDLKHQTFQQYIYHTDVAEKKYEETNIKIYAKDFNPQFWSKLQMH